MELRSLGTSGLKVSVVSLGAMTFGESKTFMKGATSPDDEAKRVFDRALDAGINLVDTANVYSEGESERLLGKWLAGKRESVVLATKCRFPIGFGQTHPAGPHDQGLSRKHIVAACEASLTRLATDYIDLYQVHMQDLSVRIDETLRALDDLVTAGKVRYVGCSNYTGYRLVESIYEAEKRGLSRYESVQLQWSLLERGCEREVVPAAEKYGVGVLVWSPLASGFLSGKVTRDTPPPTGTRLGEWKDTFKRLGGDRTYKLLDVLGAVAKQRETTHAAVAIAWLVAKKATSSVILGARTVAQLDDNLKGASLVLTTDDVKALDEASKPDWGYPYSFIRGGW
jgi:aryl-alcohol dehydrogenase-like predicted oxidoreductase